VKNTLTQECLLAFVEGIKITVTPAVTLVIKADVQGKLRDLIVIWEIAFSGQLFARICHFIFDMSDLM
jgi:hypothetical protein